MRAARVCFLVVLASGTGSTVTGDEPIARLRFRPESAAAVRSVEGPIRATRMEDLSESQRRVLERLLRESGESSGARGGSGGGLPGVSGLETTQVLFDDPESGTPPEEGNSVLVSWQEDGNQDLVELSVSSAQPFAPISGRSSPGRQLVFITDFPRFDPTNPDSPTNGFPECASGEEKANLFRISVTGSDATVDAVCQEILGSWPLANHAELCCRPAEGDSTECEEAIFNSAAEAGLDCARNVDAGEAICGIVVTGGNAGPSASEILVYVDDSPDPALSFIFEQLEDPDGIKCFERFVPVDAEREVRVTAFGFLNRTKALSTNWNDPTTQLTFSNIDGSFVGMDPNAFLARVSGFGDRPSIPELTCVVESSCSGQAGEPAFRRGDANADGTTNLSDGVFVLDALFVGDTDLPCEDAADLNDSGDINISDSIGVFLFLFGSGDTPRAPFDSCGPDPTEDALGCDTFPGTSCN